MRLIEAGRFLSAAATAGLLVACGGPSVRNNEDLSSTPIPDSILQPITDSFNCQASGDKLTREVVLGENQEFILADASILNKKNTIETKTIEGSVEIAITAPGVRPFTVYEGGATFKNGDRWEKIIFNVMPGGFDSNNRHLIVTLECDVPSPDAPISGRSGK